MTEEIFKDLCLCGETTKVQFKQAFTSQREIAKEMIAFANSKGGNALHYRGIGSGIVRILTECPNMVFQNDSDGNEFKVTLFRGILDTIQKDEVTTQKRVLVYLLENPKATRVEVADALGNIKADVVKFVIAKLQQKGLLKRVGGRKHGEWVVCYDEKTSCKYSEYAYKQSVLEDCNF
ncbi:MAG: hypothetical protein ACI3ZD_06455 [Prevotella sp.]